MRFEMEDFDQSQWHPWFAWYPIIAVGKGNKHYTVWMETVERRWDGSIDHGNWEWRIKE